MNETLSPLGRKVYAIVNYDNFEISPELVEPYAQMVKTVVDKYYTGVTRYTTSAFLRMKIGGALKQSGMTPDIYENREEAKNVLKQKQ